MSLSGVGDFIAARAYGAVLNPATPYLGPLPPLQSPQIRLDVCLALLVHVCDPDHPKALAVGAGDALEGAAAVGAWADRI